jgi:hypothetical protein
MTSQEIAMLIAQHQKKASEHVAKTLQESRASVIVETDWFSMENVDKEFKIEKILEGGEEL